MGIHGAISMRTAATVGAVGLVVTRHLVDDDAGVGATVKTAAFGAGAGLATHYMTKTPIRRAFAKHAGMTALGALQSGGKKLVSAYGDDATRMATEAGRGVRNLGSSSVDKVLAKVGGPKLGKISLGVGVGLSAVALASAGALYLVNRD